MKTTSLATAHTTASATWSYAGPPVPVLALNFFLAGLGTVVLGPLLPQLLLEWHLSDSQGGLLLFAKFAGAFLGGATVPSRLRLGVLTGHALAAIGFALFSAANGLALSLPALLCAGIGLGQMIASTNILTGRRWTGHTGSALAMLNFFWSLGAVSTGLLVAALLPRFGWRPLALALAGLLAVSGSLAALPTAGRDAPAPVLDTAGTPFISSVGLSYAGLLFFYGGLETCLTAWLTTFSLRFAGGHLLGGQSGFVVLWVALTAGRILASVAMKRFPEAVVQRVSLLFCLVLIPALARTHNGRTLSLTCILLGLALAPVFPSTFALLLRHPFAPRTAGGILAVSGLGAALFPWLMGIVSTHTASLRLGMAVPAVLVPLLLALTWADRFPPAFPRRATSI